MKNEKLMDDWYTFHATPVDHFDDKTNGKHAKYVNLPKNEKL